MKKLLAFLLSVCMVSAFSVTAFADANSDYIAAVPTRQKTPESVLSQGVYPKTDPSHEGQADFSADRGLSLVPFLSNERQNRSRQPIPHPRGVSISYPDSSGLSSGPGPVSQPSHSK